jgi:hypothetical protein
MGGRRSWLREHGNIIVMIVGRILNIYKED